MKAVIMLSAVILAAGCTSSGAPTAGERARAQAAEDQAGLAAALKGRIAGTPQDCVSLAELGGNRSYGREVVVFRGRTDDVVYVNRPLAGCPTLDVGRALKTRTTTTQLCRGDIVTVFDPVSGTDYGSCSLGAFTPYRRAR
ncbi:MAG: hypothetical protein ACM3O7_00750 [Acidobacteriota bacterium]